MTSNSISRHLSYGSAQERYEEKVLKNFTLVMKIGKHIGQIKGLLNQLKSFYQFQFIIESYIWIYKSDKFAMTVTKWTYKSPWYRWFISPVTHTHTCTYMQFLHNTMILYATCYLKLNMVPCHFSTVFLYHILSYQLPIIPCSLLGKEVFTGVHSLT